jgi:hypothetical protein
VLIDLYLKGSNVSSLVSCFLIALFSYKFFEIRVILFISCFATH